MTESALIVSAVAPEPVDSGNRLILRGLLEYFIERLGCANVHYALVCPKGTVPPEFPGVKHLLDKPNSVGQLSTLGRLVADRSYTAQEAMLGSRTLRRQIHRLVASLNPTIEVYNTLRMGQHAPAASCPRRRVLYLDDLFSVRYERMLDMASQDLKLNPLGEFAVNVPVALRALLSSDAVSRRVLRMERDRLYRREAEIVHGFNASLLVNSNEVTTLRARSECTGIQVVNGLLPSLPKLVRAPVDPPELIFLGRLNLPHNEDGICAFLRTAMSGLVHRCPGVRLRIIGRGATAAVLSLVAAYPQNVVLEGFIEDLEPVFARATASLAPLRIGGGIKIKILDALGRGVPVIATRHAVNGIPAAFDGADGCVVEDDLGQWPDLLMGMVGARRNVQLSNGASGFFDRTYGRDVVMPQYDAIFGLRPALVHRTIRTPA
jgi:glycosyltransferase involved in cell wall biosynthesis